MSNLFKDYTMRREYDGAMQAFDARHGNLFMPDGSRRRSPNLGSSLATFFWAGYDGTSGGIFRFNTPSDRNILGYAYYRAGQDARKKDPSWKLDDNSPGNGDSRKAQP